MPKSHKKTSNGNVFKFKKNMRLGAVDAENDELLDAAFVSTEDIETVMRLEDRRSLLIGRTGSGKSAILLRIEKELLSEHCIRVNPEALSMQYISNSTIVGKLSNLGVNLSLFYKLLWRHVFFVELIAARWNLDSSKQRGPFGRWLDGLRMTPAKKRCLEYFEQFGTTFFEHADQVVKNVIEKFDDDVNASLRAAVGPMSLGAGARESHSTEERSEIRQRAQKVVNDIQVRALTDALAILKEDVLNDEQKYFFVLIDDLDRPWVELSCQYQLIEALILELRDFSDIPSVKIVVALREDILQKIVRRHERSALQQREKYDTVSLSLRWTSAELEELVNRRLQALPGHPGQIPRPTVRSILPRKRRNKDAWDYILERSWQRPRDIIQFMNCCISEAPGRSTFTWSHITAAEASYSASRLASIVDEWSETYPGIRLFLEALREIDTPFTASSFDIDRLLPVLEVGERDDTRSEAFILHGLFEMGAQDDELKEVAIRLLFIVGAIAAKISPQDPFVYSYEQPHLLDNRAPHDARFGVHPGLWRALGIRPPR